MLNVVALLYLGWVCLEYDHIPNLVSFKDVDRKEFDYIIVGAGVAGSIIANKLSMEENVTVLLIEAGKVFGPLSIVPLLTTMQQRTSVDWAFKTVSQKHSSAGFVNRQQFLPRGKGLGGSSQLNFMLHYSDEETREFDNWEKLVGSAWGRENMLKYLNGNCSEDGETSSYLDQEERHDSNLTSITDCDVKLSQIFLQIKDEFFTKNEEVDFHLAQYYTKKGIRWNVYHKYLRPAFKRKNLKVLYSSRVRKVHFTENRASTVLISPEEDFQKIYLVHAKHEIILCAGAYQTPQILKLSGIGEERELKSLNINLVKDLPSVGSNLFDHVHLPLYISIENPITLTMDKILNVGEMLHYLFHGTGFYSNSGVIGFATLNGSAVGLFGMGSINEKLFRGVSNYNEETFRAIFPHFANSSQEGVVLLCTCHHPISRGTVKLRSRNPKTPPLIDPKYLQDGNDVVCMINAIKLAVRLVQSQVFQSLNPKIMWPNIRSCINFGPTMKDSHGNLPKDRYLECLLRTISITSHHPGGTCALGTSVDNRLRVKGVHGIRVADASVLPAPIAGTPSKILELIGKHAADTIIEDFKRQN
ncbi:Neither inactivation nor afterpotential protein G, partial [Pseudolycoriella hygida]